MYYILPFKSVKNMFYTVLMWCYFSNGKNQQSYWQSYWQRSCSHFKKFVHIWGLSSLRLCCESNSRLAISADSENSGGVGIFWRNCLRSQHGYGNLEVTLPARSPFSKYTRLVGWLVRSKIAIFIQDFNILKQNTMV